MRPFTGALTTVFRSSSDTQAMVDVGAQVGSDAPTVELQ